MFAFRDRQVMSSFEITLATLDSGTAAFQCLAAIAGHENPTSTVCLHVWLTIEKERDQRSGWTASLGCGHGHVECYQAKRW